MLRSDSILRSGRAEARRLLSELEALEWQKWGNPFATEITKQNCASIGLPEYFKIIKNKGMSLPTMRRKMKEDVAYSFSMFCDDVALMVSNATTYNNPGETVYNIALDLKARFEVMLASSGADAGRGAAETPQPVASKKRGRTPPP